MIARIGLVAASVAFAFLSTACSKDKSAPQTPDETAETAPTAPANASTITQSDRAAIAQLTIDAPGLQQYYHGRKPLRVVVNRHVNPAWELTFAGDRAEWVDETSDEPRIEFKLLRIEGDKAGATIHYDVEGVVMHAEFRRDSGSWRLIDADIAER